MVLGVCYNGHRRLIVRIGWAEEVNAMGKTALITGGSSGIGAEFARQLAARGHDLILVARNGERLQELAASLNGKHGVRVETLMADLADEADVARVEERITGTAAPDLLVNNAGFGVVGPFAGSDLAFELAMVDVHVIASMRLARAVLPAMLARGAGGIINVASIAGFMSLPGNATYCATKGCLITFSRVVAAEVRRRGVKVQALCPGFTVTSFHDRPGLAGVDRDRIPHLLWCAPRSVVKASLRALDRGQIVCVPGLIYKLVVLGARAGLVDRVAPWFMAR